MSGLHTWQVKLHPGRFSAMSPMMAALVGAVTGEAYTDPALRHLHVTSDGFVLAEAEGDLGANHSIGTWEDWDRNWRNLLSAAGLTDDERQRAEAARAAVTTDWRS